MVFFQGLSRQPASLTIPLVMTLLTGWLRVVALFVWTRFLPSLLPTAVAHTPALASTSLAEGVGLGIVLVIMGLVCWPFVSWVVYGWVIHLFTGCQQRAWQLAGWTLLPMTLVSVVMVGLAWAFPAMGSVTPFAEWANPEIPWFWQYFSWLSAYTLTLRGQSFQILTFWLVLAGNLVSLWLLYWGLRVFGPQRAVITTGCLTVWMVIWRIF